MARGTRSFGSDNHAGCLPGMLEAMQHAAEGDVPSYGVDPLSLRAKELLRKHFGPCTPHFVLTGTAANVLALRTVTKSYQSVLCSEVSHLNVDECGAPEIVGGFKLIPVPHTHGKITVEDVRPRLVRRGDQHVTQPRVISITQPTELGTVYTLAEMRALTSFAHEHDLLVHVDGARLVVAAASLGCSLRELTYETGVDLVSFGGTKNGLIYGEAVLFMGERDVEEFKYLRKQTLQLSAKVRFIAAQFIHWLEDDRWLTAARHSHAMAKRLAQGVGDIPGVTITHPVEANAVFARLPREVIKPLRERFFFYVWDEQTFEVRWMTSFATQPEDVDAFVATLRSLL